MEVELMEGLFGGRPRPHTWKGREHELLGEVADFWAWRVDAICRDYDAELFFPPDGERPAARMHRERVAKAICAHCPVVEECGSFALANHEPFGVWGGLSERDRDVMWRRAQREEIAEAVAQ